MSTQTEIDVAKFCESDDEGRFALGNPWVKDGKRYATNGSVLICLPAIGEPDTVDDKRRPNLREFLPPVDGDWQPWPDTATCNICNGVGTLLVKCESCMGAFEVCPDCFGRGKVRDSCVCKRTSLDLFGGCRVSIHYSSIIATLHKAEFLPNPERKGMLRFRFDGGEGAVMGMQQ